MADRHLSRGSGARVFANRRAAFGGVLGAAPLAAPAGWAAPEPRVFTTIDVRGNERFRDGDIIATSGLETGVPVFEDDIVAAVEALDFTAEFEHVRIYSDGDTLVIVVDEEPAYSGGLGFGIGYDTDVGLVGTGFLEIENAFGGEATVAARLDLGNYQYDDTMFDYTNAGITPYMSFRPDPRLAVELRYSLSSDDIYDVDDDASPIIQAESGALVSSGIGFTLATGSDLDAVDPVAGSHWSAALVQDFTGLGGDTSMSRTRVSLTGRVPLSGSGFVLRGRAAAGYVVGFDDDDPRVTDRFTLGGSRLRGFERSAVGPRDVCDGCGADTETTKLGGNQYAVLHADVVLPILQRYEGLETFVVGDVGSAWDVQTDTAPAGELVDDLEWRSSAGIGVTWRTPLGSFETYYALATDGGEYDDIQHFGLTFRSRF